MKTLYLARYFFISGWLLLAGALAWSKVFRAERNSK